jgi:type IV secretory pathway VirD2 relaxase
MSDFETVRGFEDAWRPPVRTRHLKSREILGHHAARTPDMRARLTRIVNRAPEVMVKVTGRTRDPVHLRAHLDYISRNGEQELEDRDGSILEGRREVKDLANDWSALAIADSRRRANTPFSVSVVLSMPANTDAAMVRDAARAFARETFGDRFDYVFALHTDAGHPHVHLAVRALGDHGERLNPRKADLEAWRQTYAQALRDRGIEAEATPRRARGVTRKPERGVLRRIRERHESGRGETGKVRQAAYREAAKAAFQNGSSKTPWEVSLVGRQAKVRSLYRAQAELLKRSDRPGDRTLGAKIEAFVRSMPAPDSQRLALARELRAANQVLDRDNWNSGGRDRTR